MYSKIFSQTAILAGTPANFACLADVGRHLGRVAYLLDNYIDFQNDHGRGSFNLCDQLSLRDSGRSKRQVFAQYLDQSLNAIRRSVGEVKLYRFEETVRYIVTDGLQAKVQSILSDARFVARPVIYSLAPVLLMGILRNVLTSSSSEDYCCDCSDDCDCDGGTGTSYTTTTTQQIIAPQIIDRLSEGATGGLVGGGGGVLVNEIASRMRGSTTPPLEESSDDLEPTPEDEAELEKELEEPEEPEEDTDQVTPPAKTAKTPPKLPPEPPELPKEEPSNVPPERPVKREDWLRGREPGKRPETELPPGVPKVDFKPPEEPPTDGVRIAELPPDHPVRKAFEDAFGKQFDFSQKLTEFWERVTGSGQETPEEEPVELPPHMKMDKSLVDKLTEKSILGPGDQRTPEQKAAQEAEERAGGEKAKDAVYGSGSKLYQEARDRAIPGFGDTRTFIDQINAERVEQTGSEAIRVVRQAEKLKTAVGDHGVGQRDWSGVPDAVYDRGSEYIKVTSDVKDWMKMVGQDIAYDKTGHQAMDQFIKQYGHAADSSNANDVDNFRRIYENLRGK